MGTWREDNSLIRYQEYMTIEELLTDWVDDVDRDVIRKNDFPMVRKYIGEGQRYSRLYRYIDDPHTNSDPIYDKDVGDTIEYNLISTTKKSPREAFDEWFVDDTNVLIFENVQGLDPQEYGAGKFDWEDEVIICGRFKVTDISEKSFPIPRRFQNDYRKTRLEYTQYTLSPIE